MSMALVDQSEERSAASNAIEFALMAHKNHYDRSHQSLYLKVGDYVSLHLYKGHSISSILRVTKKQTQQYVRLFRVLKKVGRLVYRNVLPNWHIYPLFLVAQLEPAPPLSQDPFQQLYSAHLLSVFIEGDTDRLHSFEVERLLNCRIIKRGRRIVTQYLVGWVRYKPKFDQWYSLKELDNDADLVWKYEAALPK